MTRGYVIFIKNKKYYKVAYSGGDSYLTGLGREVFLAINSKDKERAMLSIIDGLNKVADGRDIIDASTFCKSCYSKKEQLDELLADGVISNRKEGIDKYLYFYDYAYEYNADKNVLTVYHFGDKIYTFKTKNDFAYLDFLTDSESFEKKCLKGIDYRTVLAYNFDSFKQNYKKNNPDRQVRQYMRENKDISELKSYLIHTAEKIRLIDEGRYVDIGNSIKNFKERYTIFLDDGRRVEFYIPFFFEDYDNRYTAHMQFPDRRIPINFQFKTVSAKKIVKAVDEFILSHTEDFSKLHDVTVLWKSASESIRALNEKKSVKEHTMLPADYHSELDKTAKDTFYNNIQDIIAKDSYYLQGRLSLKYLLDNFSDNIYHMCTNYDYAYRHK